VALVARWVLQIQWVSIFVGAALAPVIVRPWLSEATLSWAVAIALAMAAGVTVSVYVWRRGGHALSLAPVSAASAFGVLVAYGAIAPAENRARSHRVLAQSLPQHMSSGVRKVMFFSEIDEGLSYYATELDLAPVPGTQRRYNTAYDLAQSYRTERFPHESVSDIEAKRLARDKRCLIEWLDQNSSGNSYLLIRRELYDRFCDDLAGRASQVLREQGLKRNELALLRASRDRPPRATTATTIPTRR
jgi:hypothetical protein